MNGYESTENIYTHVKVCRDSLNNEGLFTVFKSVPAYKNVLEHCSVPISVNAINGIIKNYDVTKINWDSVRENDKYGTPSLHDFKSYMSDHVELENYYFSPSTIQYLYQALDILSEFSKRDDKKEISIVEVGGGYGGLCKIINVIAPMFGISITKYILIDLKDVCAHQDKYLQRVGVTNHVTVPYDSDEIDKNVMKHDLFISIYALGEFTPTTCQFYIDNVLKYSRHTYLWWNLSHVNDYFKDYDKSTTGILYNHPHGMDLKIVN